MRHSQGLVLLGAIAQSGLTVASSLPRGVGPEFASYYTSKDSFTCIGNPSIKLSFSQVNDDSCDCPDGSDEPGTAACTYLDPLSPPQPLPGSATGTTNTTLALPGFYCNNVGHVGAYLPFMYVNDGVCDYELCCDGTDEFASVGGVRCENRCEKIGAEHRKAEEEKRKSYQRAVRRRRALVKEGQAARRKVDVKIAAIQEEMKRLSDRRAELQARFEEIEKEERGKVYRPEGEGGGKISVLRSVAKKRVDELRDTLDKVLDQRDDLKERVEELEEILKKFKEEYNPNFNDEGVKAAVKAWEDYAARVEDEKIPDINDKDILEVLKEDSETHGVNWAEFVDEPVADTDILYKLEAYLPESVRSYIHGKLNLLRIWLIQKGVLPDGPAAGGQESRLVTAAREAVESAAADLSAKSHELFNEQNELSKDYGPDDVFRSLKGKCMSTEAGEYEYELCWWEGATQKNRKGHGSTNMGNFAGLDYEEADSEDRADGRSLGKGRRMVLRYENGQSCWNGPQRKTDVWLACAEQDELWRVTETEKCVYKMEVGTPAACEDDATVQESGSEGKDEL